MSLFWLGVHNPAFLERTAVPCCIHFGHLRGRRRLPRPLGPVLIDSWGFTELQRNGAYAFTHREYADTVRRCRDEWGDRLVGATVMDWMCEPDVIAGNPEKGFVGTGLSVATHQQLTVNSWVELNSLDGSLPWVPVVQGYAVEDYHRCVELYRSFACTDLTRLPLVGVGSVCRRQKMTEAAVIVQSLYARGLTNLHGFGFKITGLVSRRLRLARYLKSSDSMAWSYDARQAWKYHRRQRCGTGHVSRKTGWVNGCANCLPWALLWRDRLVRLIGRVIRFGTQGLLF